MRTWENMFGPTPTATHYLEMNETECRIQELLTQLRPKHNAKESSGPSLLYVLKLNTAFQTCK